MGILWECDKHRCLYNSKIIINKGIGRFISLEIAHSFIGKGSSSNQLRNIAFAQEYFDKLLNRFSSQISSILNAILRLTSNTIESFIAKTNLITNEPHLLNDDLFVFESILYDIFIDTIKHTESFTPPLLLSAVKEMSSKSNFVVGFPRFTELCSHSQEHVTILLRYLILIY